MNFKSLAVLGLTLTYLIVFGEASLSKILGGSAPDWFLQQFAGTLIDFGPASLRLQFWSIALAEFIVAVLLVVALARREFWGGREVFLTAALTLALFVFAGLGFGLRITHKYADAASLFNYAFATFVCLRLLSRPEPA